MRVVKEEAQEHYRALLATMSAIQGREGGAEAAAPEDAAAVMVHNRALLRNKRLMLAYMCVARRCAPPRCERASANNARVLCCTWRLTRRVSARSNARMGRIKALRWTVGGGLPADLSAALSPSERDFFSAYNRRAPPAPRPQPAPHTFRAPPGCWAPTWAVPAWV